MEKYRINSAEQLTPELILSLVDRYKLKEVARLKRLYRYYENNSDIKKRTMSDKTKPNNTIATPFANYITSTVLGYFLGKPVSYQSSNPQLMESVQYIFDTNEEQSHNAKLGVNQSIYGIAYELMFLNEDGQVKFSSLNPTETFLIYDTSIISKPIAGVRFFDIQDYTAETSTMYVELYTNSNIYHYKIEKEELILFAEEVHYFNAVPIIAYVNSDERFGDYERVIDLIDAFDLTISDQQNSLEYFADSYLLISGMDITDEEMRTMRENRIILTDEQGQASFLIKDATTQGLREYQTTLQENIHTFSFVPDMSDEKFSNASGESLKYKLLGLENAVSIKERHFKQGLEERIRLIVNFLNLKAHNYDDTDIVISFTRNMPTNNSDVVDMVSKLKGLLSDTSLISLLPFVEDAAYELELVKQQKEDSIDSMGTY